MGKCNIKHKESAKGYTPKADFFIYINLTQLLKTLNVKQIKFAVTIPDKYEIYAIQILEVSNEYKPSQGDVRDQYINPKYK